MGFSKFGLNQIAHTGTVDGAAYKVHTYHSNDTIAQIETDGYFDSYEQQFTLGKGDILFVIADLDGTPAFHAYRVTRTAGDIALTQMVATADS